MERRNFLKGGVLAGAAGFSGVAAGNETSSDPKLYAIHPDYRPGRYYHLGRGSFKPGSGISTTGAVDYISLYPFLQPRFAYVDGFAVNLNEGAVGNYKIAIYEHDNATNRPTGSPWAASTGSLSTDVAPGVLTCNCPSTPLAANTIYWAAIHTSSNARFIARDFASNEDAWLIGSNVPADILGRRVNIDGLELGAIGTYFLLHERAYSGVWPAFNNNSVFERVQTLQNAAIAFRVG